MSNLIWVFGLISLFSVSVNVALVWWGVKMIKKNWFVTENVDELIADIEAFGSHLKKVYELPTFYGDDTLKGLLDHSKIMAHRCSDFRLAFTIDDTDVDDEYNEEEEELKGAIVTRDER